MFYKIIKLYVYIICLKNKFLRYVWIIFDIILDFINQNVYTHYSREH
jgi:hypothetical protein